ncbi:putative DNA cytosine methyltransferase [Citrobacter phage vB_CfrD_BlueShadow]|uniref:DNA cytosine methyltransferase n=1 Tax=Citrobacter phage vB_CfrD_BlueShadow TaxID=2902660 RepID=A0AC61TQB6_9CAUD|nr:putative DNA cytosine methyltransferase [Citrobacter phage vB_CfrD_BlueShadow]
MPHLQTKRLTRSYRKDLNMLIFSLFDGSGYAALPWAERGHKVLCFNFDGADHGDYQSVRVTHPNIVYLNEWIGLSFQHNAMMRVFGTPDFIIAFPPCTDLAVSGSRHFAAKRERDPDFQKKAVETAKIAANIADRFNVPYIIENPVSVLSSMWRQPDFIFHPCAFGDLLPEDDKHPHFPEIIPARDAYTKKTCLWTGNGFVMPDTNAVLPTGNNNPGWQKLGGKSKRTKLIRSLTPRGFALAVCLANQK